MSLEPVPSFHWLTLHFRRLFGCGAKLDDFNWKALVEHLQSLVYEECQSFIDTLLGLTVEDFIFAKYPPKRSFQLRFLKRFVAEAEKSGVQHDRLYELIVESLNAHTDENSHYKHYFLKKKRFIIKEKANIISGGTTGLCAWQAGIALVNWVVRRPQIVSGRHILELGCGVGLTGLALIYSENPPSSYVFTDVHASVLKALKLNLTINSSEWNFCETRVQVERLDWASVSDIRIALKQRPEVILASDVVYCLELIPILCDALKWLIEYCEGSIAVIACTVRNVETLDGFIECLGSVGLEVVEECFAPVDNCELYCSDDTPVKTEKRDMRGNAEEKEKPDLLVFGYACKVFRDDEKAHFIDSGQHLISWMGDDSLKIDRYDGRGALYDLTAHEPKDVYPDGSLSEEEMVVEKMCDEERWRSLYINEDEEATYKEEEAKRIQQAKGYGEVSYKYESTPTPEEPVQEEPVPSKPFTPPPELNLPADMKYPETVKQNAIIEKTALFLAQQGSQMEILMKVKQKGNKFFDFLSHNDPLHDYYKHLKNLIKTGSYVPKEQFSEEDSAVPNSGDDHYLHPSLVISASAPKEPSLQPSEHLKKIVEKMVTYVVRNGTKFEDAIKKLNDPRFSFLSAGDPHHHFYSKQREAALKAISDRPEAGKSLKRKLPVCFSIKKPKENEGLEVSSALPVEESSDEDGEEGKTENDSDSVINSLEKRIKTSSEIAKQRREKKDALVQNERKIKVAQFLKDLKKKGP